MQSSLNVPPNFPTSQIHSPWRLRKTHISTPLKNPSFRPLRISNSLKTSFDYSFDYFEEGEINKQDELPLLPAPLPVAIRQSGSVSRYYWDVSDLQLVSVDGRDSFALLELFLDDFGGGFRRLVRVCGTGVRNFFLPREFNENYLKYVKWKFLHRVFSSALQVLATQAMFRAIGIGYARSLPSAAALNWILKDGLGRLSRCIYTASLASAFDTNLKRVRFSTSVMFSLSIGVELLTPAFPQYFLLLATVANIAKQISLACYLATASAVHRSFAIADNLGEVSAKAQIQSVCFDNLGLMLAAALNIMLQSSQRWQAGLPFVVYPVFAAIDLYGIYQGLKHVHLQTLTKDRLEIIINTWIQLGYVPSPAEVSKEEEIDFFWSKAKQLWPIRIGFLHPRSQVPKLSMMTMQSLNDEDLYFICMESCCHGSAKTGQHGILLCLREGAGTADVIMGLLQACYVRRSVLCDSSKWDDLLLGCESSGVDATLRNWFQLIEDSKQSARKEMSFLNGRMVGLGWACKNILLSTQEQARYSFVED